MHKPIHTLFYTAFFTLSPSCAHEIQARQPDEASTAAYAEPPVSCCFGFRKRHRAKSVIAGQPSPGSVVMGTPIENPAYGALSHQNDNVPDSASQVARPEETISSSEDNDVVVGVVMDYALPSSTSRERVFSRGLVPVVEGEALLPDLPTPPPLPNSDDMEEISLSSSSDEADSAPSNNEELAILALGTDAFSRTKAFEEDSDDSAPF